MVGPQAKRQTVDVLRNERSFGVTRARRLRYPYSDREIIFGYGLRGQFRHASGCRWKSLVRRTNVCAWPDPNARRFPLWYQSSVTQEHLPAGPISYKWLF